MNAPDRDPFALGGTDPLIALWAEHCRIRAKREALPFGGKADKFGGEYDQLGGKLTEIEDQMDVLVPISIAGALAQLRYLRFYGDFVISEVDQLVGNMIAGLEQLVNRPEGST